MATPKSSMPVVSGRFSLPYAAAAAFFIEALLVTALVIGLSDIKKTSPPKQQPVMLSFPVLPAAPLPKPARMPPPKVPVKPAPRRLPTPVHRVVHRATPQAHQVEAPDPAPEPLAMAPATPNTVPAPPQAAPVRQADKPSPPSVDPHIQARFEDQVRAAVQSAMRYPYAAMIAHIAGRAQVSFEYIDGRVSAVKIAISSGYGMLDSAALQAVSAAAYPPPPKNLAGKSLPFEVWVRFYQTGLSSD
ncbi:MAG: TonB family protein [Sulfuricella sp.]